ncbi:MAG: hypothetical protein WAW10_07275 [Gallionella sp.]
MENILISSSSENCTLILVHHTELLKQWQERLQTFLGAGKDVVGVIGGDKNRPTGKIDIAAKCWHVAARQIFYSLMAATVEKCTFMAILPTVAFGLRVRSRIFKKAAIRKDSGADGW